MQNSWVHSKSRGLPALCSPNHTTIKAIILMGGLRQQGVVKVCGARVIYLIRC